MDLKSLFLKVSEYWIPRLRKELSPQLKYHSIEHTLRVIEFCEQIAHGENLSNEDLYLLQIAAVFHDAGFLESPKNHEERSCSIAKAYLLENNIDQHKIDQVCQMIMATKVPQNPTSYLGEILCDADLAYIGTHLYKTNAAKLFEEITLLGGNLSETEWLKAQISFLENHHFFTDYAKSTYAKGKQEVLHNLKAELQTKED